MRLLYVPFFTNKNVEGCSVYNNMKTLLRTMVDRNPDMYLYYPLPEDPFDIGDAHEYLEHPRIHVFRVPALPMQSEEVTYLPDIYIRMFHKIFGTHHFDVLICDKHYISLWAHTLLNSNVRNWKAPSPVINIMQYPISQEGRHQCTKELEAAQVIGWLFGYNVFLSEYDRDFCAKVVRKYASGRALKLFLERPYMVGPAALDFGRIDANRKPKPRDKIIFHFGSRLASHYHPGEILREAEILYMTGRPVELVITSPSKSAYGAPVKETIKRLQAGSMPYELLCPCPQQLFYKKAWQAHLSAFLIEQGGPMAVPREMAYMRVALAIPRVPVWDDLLPDYPFRFDTQDELRGLLAWLADHYWDDDVQEKLEEASRKVRAKWEPDAFADGLAALIRQAEADHRPDPDPSVIEIVDSTLERAGDPDEFTLSEFEAWLKKYPDTPLSIRKHSYRGRSRNDFIASARLRGFRDTCDGPELRMRKQRGDGDSCPNS